MPGDLFGDVSEPSVRVGSRKWYTVPLSLLAHAVALAAAIVVPLMAAGALPSPPDGIDDFIDVTLPPTPRPPAPKMSVTPVARVNPAAAPLVAPSTIAPEPNLPVLDAAPAGVEGGIPVPGAIEHGLPEPVVAPPSPAPVSQAPVRPGGDIRPPRKIRDVPPVYPPIALSARVQGTVIIEATLDTAGRVQDARVLRGVPLLDQAALEAVRQWVYTPTRLNGVPVPVIMTVTVTFGLR